jgi:acetyl-CoA synthetase
VGGIRTFAELARSSNSVANELRKLPDETAALDIFTHIATALPPYKRIRRIELAVLPKTISGKIRRVELRRLENERRAAGNDDVAEFRWEDFAELKNA